jgi:hypothetical protein
MVETMYNAPPSIPGPIHVSTSAPPGRRRNNMVVQISEHELTTDDLEAGGILK